MLNFSKMHSLGNDFMVIDGVTTSIKLDPEQVAAWGNRQRGIGFDQLLLVAPPSSPNCDFDYVIFNADGSEAQQCGSRRGAGSHGSHGMGQVVKLGGRWSGAGRPARPAAQAPAK